MAEWFGVFQVEDPVWRHLIQAGVIIVGGYVLAKLLYRLVHLIGYKISAKTETDLDDKIVAIFEKSVQRIVNTTALYFAINRLEPLFQGTWLNYVDGAFFVVMVILATILLTSVTKTIIEWYVATIAVRTESPLDEEILPLIRRLLNMLLYSIALMICLDHFHIDIKALVVSLGVGSFAIAFAAQETLSNMIAGFVIMVDRPFRVGDRIRITAGNITGDIVKVGLRSTQILDFDYNIVTVPNAQIVKSDIINFAYPDPTMRLRIDVGIAYGSDIEKAKKILVEVLLSDERILKEPLPEVAVTGFGDSSVQLAAIGRVRHYKEHFETGDTVRDRIHSSFARHGIEIPYPHRVIIARTEQNAKNG